MNKCSTCKTFRKPNFYNFMRFRIKKLFKAEKYYKCSVCNIWYRENENSVSLHWITQGLCIALTAYAIIWVPINISILIKVLIYALALILLLLLNTAIYWTYVRFTAVDNFEEDK